MKSTILLCINGKTYGGAEKMCLALAKELRALDSKVILLLNSKELAGHPNIKDYPHFILKRQKFLNKYDPFTFLPDILRFTFLLLKIRPGLIIFENKFLLQIGAIPAKVLGVKFYTYIHYPPAKYELKACFYHLAEKILICSAGLKKYFQPENFYSEKIKILPNFVDPVLSKTIVKPEADAVLCCTGHIAKVKGQLQLIEVVKYLKDQNLKVKLFIVGSVREENLTYLKKCKDLVNKYNLVDEIEFTGQVNNAVDYLNVSDIYLQPSESEGLPLSVLEALYFGLPVISYDIDGLSEAIKNNENGFLAEPQNLSEFQERVCQLVKDKDLRQDFSKKSKEIYQRYFTKEKFIESLQKHFLCK